MRIFYSIGLMLFALSSCGIYRQNVTNVPLLSEKGQSQISGHFGANGYDGHVAYALSHNIAILANYSFFNNKKESSSTNYTSEKHNFTEFGAGYYKKKETNTFFECFLIAGNGMTQRFVLGSNSVSGQTIPFTNFRKAYYNRFLIQSNFGYLDKKIEYAFSPRILLVHYYNITDNSTSTFKQLPSTFLYSDASLTLRYSLTTNIKISAQSSLTIPITGYKAGYFEASPINCSIGLTINFNLFKQ